jgi:hypothetical protein
MAGSKLWAGLSIHIRDCRQCVPQLWALGRLDLPRLASRQALRRGSGAAGTQGGLAGFAQGRECGAVISSTVLSTSEKTLESMMST